MLSGNTLLIVVSGLIICIVGMTYMWVKDKFGKPREIKEKKPLLPKIGTKINRNIFKKKK